MMPGGGSSASKGLGELKRAASTVSYFVYVYNLLGHYDEWFCPLFIINY